MGNNKRKAFYALSKLISGQSEFSEDKLETLIATCIMIYGQKEIQDYISLQFNENPSPREINRVYNQLGLK